MKQTAVEAAECVGIDLSLTDELLRLSPEQRARQHQMTLEMALQLETAYASEETMSDVRALHERYIKLSEHAVRLCKEHARLGQGRRWSYGLLLASALFSLLTPPVFALQLVALGLNLFALGFIAATAHSMYRLVRQAQAVVDEMSEIDAQLTKLAEQS